MLAATPIRCPRSSLEGALTTEDARKRGEVAGASAQQQRGLGRTHAEAPHLRPVCVCVSQGGWGAGCAGERLQGAGRCMG